MSRASWSAKPAKRSTAPSPGKRVTAGGRRGSPSAGLAAGELHDIKLAALLHDIGLLMLPPRLSRTIEPLEPEAYVTVQNHSRLGANLLEPFSFLREASILIAHHHERWDGTGYPYGIRGEFIPLGARILAIADAFDAIEVPDVSSRERRNTVAARIVMVASGSQFDPALVQLLCRWVGAGREVGDLSLL